MQSWRGLSLFVILFAAFHVETFAQGGPQPDFSAIKLAVVTVVAKGTDPTQGNKEVAVQGTGFFISKEGYLVTSYHLKTKLGQAVDDGTVIYEVSFGPNDRVQAAEVYTIKTNDILVLFASIGDRDVPVFQRGTRNGISLATTAIYVAGYPEGYQYSVRPGAITSFGLIEPIPAWQTNFSFKEGQSGSPVFKADTTVVAVVRGNDHDAASFGIVVPVRPIPAEYWDKP
jgi:S1-C subfamily serine protease